MESSYDLPAWHVLPFDVLIHIFRHLSLTDLMAVQHLNAQCCQAVEYHYRRVCSQVVISEALIAGAFSRSNYTPHFMERVALLLSRIGRFVRVLMVDVTTHDCPNDPDAERNRTAIQNACIVITQLMLNFCPKAHQYVVRGLHPMSGRKAYRIYNAPFTHLGILEPNAEQLNELAELMSTVAEINLRNDIISAAMQNILRNQQRPQTLAAEFCRDDQQQVAVAAGVLRDPLDDDFNNMM